MNMFTKQKDSQMWKTNPWLSKGTVGQEGEMDQELEINRYTLLYKIGKQQGPTVQHRKLYSIIL